MAASSHALALFPDNVPVSCTARRGQRTVQSIRKSHSRHSSSGRCISMRCCSACGPRHTSCSELPETFPNAGLSPIHGKRSPLDSMWREALPAPQLPGCRSGRSPACIASLPSRVFPSATSLKKNSRTPSAGRRYSRTDSSPSLRGATVGSNWYSQSSLFDNSMILVDLRESRRHECAGDSTPNARFRSPSESRYCDRTHPQHGHFVVSPRGAAVQAHGDEKRPQRSQASRASLVKSVPFVRTVRSCAAV